MLLKNIISEIRNNTFRSFHHRNYRLYFYGQSISVIGTWIQRIATPWLVYRLTDSVLMLGIISFAAQIPTLIISPFAGVIVDQVNKYKLLVVTQILSLLQAAILAALYITQSIEIWHVVALNIFLGIINAFDAPARQSLLVELVEGKKDLPNAIALNSAIFNGARLIGPTIAGVLIAVTGEGICFLINALSYIFVVISLLRMKIPQTLELDLKSYNILQNLKDGFSYTFRSISIRSVLLLLSVSSLTAMQYTVLMPVFSREILHGNSTTFGFLMASAGIGAFIGTFILASKKNAEGLEKFISAGSFIFGIALVLFALNKVPLFSFALLFVVGAGMMLQTASTNTLIQSIVEEDKRGRVMSIYTMAFMGTAPFGSLLTGWLAKIINVSNTLLVCGFIVLLASLFYRFFILKRN